MSEADAMAGAFDKRVEFEAARAAWDDANKAWADACAAWFTAHDSVVYSTQFKEVHEAGYHAGYDVGYYAGYDAGYATARIRYEGEIQ